MRARRFPSLVNCVVIDWFQPWPEEALASVSKRFLDPIDLGTEEAKASVIGFMPYSFLAVEKESARYLAGEGRYNYTTPKSFLELIALYTSMLGKRREETNALITRYVNGVEKLKTTAESVGVLQKEVGEVGRGGGSAEKGEMCPTSRRRRPRRARRPRAPTRSHRPPPSRRRR